MSRARIILVATLILSAAIALWTGVLSETVGVSIGRWTDVDGQGAAPRVEIPIATLREHVRYLASDELGGRSTGSAGYAAAAAFVEAELSAYGVEPLFPSSGRETTSFRQPFDLSTWSVARGGSMTIRAGIEPVELELLRDLQVAYAASDAAWRRDLPVVYVGAGVVEPDLGYDDLAGLDLDGACVVILFDLSTSMLADAPPELRDRNPSGNRGIARRVSHAARRGAVCAITVHGPSPPDFWGAFLRDPGQLDARGSVPRGDAGFVDFAVAISTRGTAALFAHQRGNPDLDDGLEPFALDDVTVRFDLDLSASERLETANIGGLVPGTDPALADEMIVLTAHLDGQGTRADGVVLNSANDNAASVVALLAAARHLVAAPARRPIAIVFTGAEEDGLAGAEHFVDDPPVPLTHVALNVNMEMVGKRRRRLGTYQFRVAGRHSDAIETLVRATQRRHGDVDLDYERRFETPDYQFRRADHAHFFLRGVPTIYFYGGGADYHQPSDDADGIEYAKVRTMAEVLVDLIRVTDISDALPVSDGRP